MDLTGITRIVKIGIHHGDLIYGFSVYFERNGTTQFDGRWGGNRGKLIQVRNFLQHNLVINVILVNINEDEGSRFCFLIIILKLISR